VAIYQCGVGGVCREGDPSRDASHPPLISFTLLFHRDEVDLGGNLRGSGRDVASYSLADPATGVKVGLSALFLSDGWMMRISLNLCISKPSPIPTLLTRAEVVGGDDERILELEETEGAMVEAGPTDPVEMPAPTVMVYSAGS
jgi:hypothetical protein